MFISANIRTSNLIPLHAITADEQVERYSSSHSKPNQQMKGNGQLHAIAALHPQKKAPSTQWTGGWVGPGVEPEQISALLDTKPQFFSCPLHRPFTTTTQLSQLSPITKKCLNGDLLRNAIRLFSYVQLHDIQQSSVCLSVLCTN